MKKECVVCKKKFETKYPQKKLCSKACKIEWAREKIPAFKRPYQIDFVVACRVGDKVKMFSFPNEELAKDFFECSRKLGVECIIGKQQ